MVDVLHALELEVDPSLVTSRESFIPRGLDVFFHVLGGSTEFPRVSFGQLVSCDNSGGTTSSVEEVSEVRGFRLGGFCCISTDALRVVSSALVLVLQSLMELYILDWLGRSAHLSCKHDWRPGGERLGTV